MQIEELKNAVRTIITDTTSKLAALCPEDAEITAYFVRKHWPDPDEMSEQVKNEAEWLVNQAAMKQKED